MSDLIKKTCTNCHKEKPLLEFGKKKSHIDGLASECKDCNLIRQSIRSKMKDGVTLKAYGHQKENSLRRNHKPPEYSLKELRDWAYLHPIFHELYDKWVRSGYKKMLKPSFDRTDDYLCYSLNRLTIMTWQENKDKWNADRKSGVNNKHSKVVVQMNLDGALIKEFHSGHEASRQTGVNRGNISSCCTGRYKTVGGFKWKYKDA